jgi:hypothetical protein
MSEMKILSQQNKANPNAMIIVQYTLVNAVYIMYNYNVDYNYEHHMFDTQFANTITITLLFVFNDVVVVVVH